MTLSGVISYIVYDNDGVTIRKSWIVKTRTSGVKVDSRGHWNTDSRKSPTGLYIVRLSWFINPGLEAFVGRWLLTIVIYLFMCSTEQENLSYWEFVQYVECFRGCHNSRSTDITIEQVIGWHFQQSYFYLSEHNFGPFTSVPSGVSISKIYT